MKKILWSVAAAAALLPALLSADAQAQYSWKPDKPVTIKT